MRVIIGECERAGLPISAPEVRRNEGDFVTQVRWVKKNDTYVLEFFNVILQLWEEVPFVPNP